MRNTPSVNSSVSIDILDEKIKEYFEKQGKASVVFCDNLDILFKKCTVLDVVLLGAGMKDIFKFNIWPRSSSFRIWVLNTNHKRRFCKYLGFDQKQIGVINRYELFPINATLAKFDISQKFCNFIYSSRALTLKNFDLTLRFLNYLIEKKGKVIELDVLAPMFKVEDFSRYVKNNNKVKINYVGDIGTDWHLKITKKENQALINFSLDPIDDYNVSLAQWQSIGGAIITSNFSTFRDVKGDNVFKVSCADLFEEFMNKDSAIFDKLYTSIYKDNQIFGNNLPPDFISYEELARTVLSVSRRVQANIFELNSYNPTSFLSEFINDEG